MRFRILGRTNLVVSEFCLGTMTFGGKTTEEQAREIVDLALDSGVNFIDTAPAYEGGRSEEMLGRVLQGVRDKVVLATKVGFGNDVGPTPQVISRSHITRAVERSLRRLKTDRIDLYQIHWPHRQMELEAVLRTLDDLVHQGKIFYIGVCNFPGWLVSRSLWLAELRNLASVISLQVPYNLIERGIEVEVLPLCAAHGVGVIVYRPLAIGVLTGKYLSGIPPESRGRVDERCVVWNERYKVAIERLVSFASERSHTAAQAALAWVKDAPGVTSPIVGISRPKQLEENLKAFDWDLTAEERCDIASWFSTEVKEEAGGVFPSLRRSFDLVR